MANANTGILPPPVPNTLTISDGKAERAIWQDGDGNGDPSVELFEASRHAHDGHPTWKIYCGDAPKRVNGVVIEPPRFVYLDDAAAARVLAWPAYSRPHRARCWRFDFSSKGDVRPRRPNRGRPAYNTGGQLVGVEGGGPSGAAYAFSGGSRKDLETLAAMRVHGLLEHQSVKVPVDIPGPQTRVIHSPEMAPKTSTPQPAVAAVAGAKRKATEDLEEVASPVTPSGTDAGSDASSVDEGRMASDLAFYRRVANRLYTMHAFAAYIMDRVATIDEQAKKLTQEIAALRSDQLRHTTLLENLEGKVMIDNPEKWVDFTTALPGNELGLDDYWDDGEDVEKSIEQTEG